MKATISDLSKVPTGVPCPPKNFCTNSPKITNKYIKEIFIMKLLKKTLHLNYSEPKGDKQVVKSYSFNVNADTDDKKESFSSN